MASEQHRINPAWCDAPYEVDYLLSVPSEPRRLWSRKRRLKWKRRLVRQMVKWYRYRYDLVFGVIPDAERTEVPVLYRRGNQVLE